MTLHLAVLVHGLWGNPEHMWYVKKALHDRHPEVEILVSDSNIGNRTYDGIDVCGERIAKEVRGKVEALEEDGGKVTKVSFVGYSLGGLGARYAIGVLESTGFFKDVKPMTFTTFATPHVGVSPVSGGFFSWLVSSIGPRTLSVTGAHIFLADRLVKKKPLLEAMSLEDSRFFQGLALFKSRTAYGNIKNDRSVPFYTSHMTDTDPFLDLTKVHVNHDSSYGDTILDAKLPYTKALDHEKVEAKKYPLNAREIIFRTIILAGFPLWLTLYTANAIYSNFRSSQRITSHRSTYPDESSSLLSSMTQDVVEGVIDTSPSDSDPHKIKLNQAQSNIVANLNKLKWNKVFVHIQKTQHSHAAIVCRTRDSDRLSEGHNVMRHWLDTVFIA